MHIEEQFDVSCAAAVVYRELSDVSGIGHCIAGVKDVAVLGEGTSRWTIEVTAGFMALTVVLDGGIVERRPGEHIAFRAAGQDVELKGHVDLEESADGALGTRCNVVIDAEIGDPLGPLAVMARGAQEQLVAETVRNVRAWLATGPTTPIFQARASRLPVPGLPHHMRELHWPVGACG